MAIRNEANKALEIRRQEKLIGSSLDARLIIAASAEDKAFLMSYAAFLPALFIVSDVELADSPGAGAYESAAIPCLAITVERASGEKCGRCWTWSPSVGDAADHPGLCGRCHGVIA
jgi:isoleucyl-tRNA synthetase